jgi:hypothetical protein
MKSLLDGRAKTKRWKRSVIELFLIKIVSLFHLNVFIMKKIQKIPTYPHFNIEIFVKGLQGQKFLKRDIFNVKRDKSHDLRKQKTHFHDFSYPLYTFVTS